VSPVQGKVARGGEADISLTVHVDGGIGGSAGALQGEQLDTILVMTVAGSGDKFISITGTYAFSCFGVSPDKLAERRPHTQERIERLCSQYASSTSSSSSSGSDDGQGKEQEQEQEEEEEEEVHLHLEEVLGGTVKCVLNLRKVERKDFEAIPIVPLELQNLVHFIGRDGGLKAPGLFISPSYPSEEAIQATRAAMDSDSAVPADRVTPVDASLVLLLLLSSYPQPLLPKQVADVCSLCVPDSMASLDLLKNNMTKTSFASFLFLMKFFRAVLRGQRDCLTADDMAATLASIFLTYEITSGGPLSAEGTMGYADIIKRRGHFLKQFLVVTD